MSQPVLESTQPTSPVIDVPYAQATPPVSPDYHPNLSYQVPVNLDSIFVQEGTRETEYCEFVREVSADDTRKSKKRKVITREGRLYSMTSTVRELFPCIHTLTITFDGDSVRLFPEYDEEEIVVTMN